MDQLPSGPTPSAISAHCATVRSTIRRASNTPSCGSATDVRNARAVFSDQHSGALLYHVLAATLSNPDEARVGLHGNDPIALVEGRVEFAGSIGANARDLHSLPLSCLCGFWIKARTNVSR